MLSSQFVQFQIFKEFQKRRLEKKRTKMEEIMTTTGFCGFRTRILKHLDYQDLEQLCKMWSGGA